MYEGLKRRAARFQHDLQSGIRPGITNPEFTNRLSYRFGKARTEGNFGLMEFGAPNFLVFSNGLPAGQVWCEPDQLLLTANTEAFRHLGIEGLETAMATQFQELEKKDPYMRGERTGYVPQGILFWLQAPGTVRMSLLSEPDVDAYVQFMMDAGMAYHRALR
jgi:hypothetical protein